jgi:hypothetical protein
MFDDPQSGAPAPQPQAQGGGGSIDPQQAEAMKKWFSQSHQSLQPPPVKQPGLGKKIAENVGFGVLNAFVPFVGGGIQRAVKQDRENEIAKAMYTYNIMMDRYERYQYLSGGDKQKFDQMINQDPQLQAIYSDKKIRKQLQKVFGTDLLNPDKQNTVWHEGLKRVLKEKEAFEKVKQLHDKMQEFEKRQPPANASSQQPPPQQDQGGGQGSPQPGQGQQGQDIAGLMNRLPQHTSMPDPKQLEETSLAIKNAVEAQVQSEPKTEFQAWYRQSTQENGGKRPSTEQIQAHHDANKLKPIDQLVQDAIDLESTGDHAGAQKKFELAKTATMALAKTPQPTLMGTIFAANAGDPNSKAALKSYEGMQMRLREAYGLGRAKFMMAQYLNRETGEASAMSAYDASRLIAAGQPLTLVGALSPKDIQVAQRLITETGPKDSKFYETGALKGLYDNISAYDNPKDRAIFAKIMKAQPRPTSGLVSDAYAYMGQILDQALRSDSGLSTQGRNLSIAQKRMAESMGVYRALSGMPSTDQSMDITLGLLLGGTTPDSAFAKQQIDMLNQMITNMVNVPIIKPATQGMQGKPTDKPKKMSLQDFLDKQN